MKKPNKLLFQIFAAGAAGVAFFAIANAPAVRGDVVLGIGASIALLAVANADYSRRARSLSAPAELVRPALPVTTTPAAGHGSRHDRCAA